MNHNQTDISKMIEDFQRKNSSVDRYASFDYCYHYFHPSTANDLISDIEKSCLSIGFYLASWGMLRGSSFLLNKSIKFYEPLIEYIADLDASVWDIDVDKYSDENIKTIRAIYKEIKRLMINKGNSHLTLVTKIMLGVFGFLPAYDNFFGNTFRKLFQGTCGFRSVNSNSLNCIHKFYTDNKQIINRYSSEIHVKEFTTGNDSNITYPKSKIIDMYGFAKGLKQST